ncbi:unnamed protein product [Amoebophrya sp. A120]|nr:unnamed protein product [Amoebophrya sp. A120]|eukprot:GSA120T00009306001.1
MVDDLNAPKTTTGGSRDLGPLPEQPGLIKRQTSLQSVSTRAGTPWDQRGNNALRQYFQENQIYFDADNVLFNRKCRDWRYSEQEIVAGKIAKELQYKTLGTGGFGAVYECHENVDHVEDETPSDQDLGAKKPKIISSAVKVIEVRNREAAVLVLEELAALRSLQGETLEKMRQGSTKKDVLGSSSRSSVFGEQGGQKHSMMELHDQAGELISPFLQFKSVWATEDKNLGRLTSLQGEQNGEEPVQVVRARALSSSAENLQALLEKEGNDQVAPLPGDLQMVHTPRKEDPAHQGNKPKDVERLVYTRKLLSPQPRLGSPSLLVEQQQNFDPAQKQQRGGSSSTSTFATQQLHQHHPPAPAPRFPFTASAVQAAGQLGTSVVAAHHASTHQLASAPTAPLVVPARGPHQGGRQHRRVPSVVSEESYSCSDQPSSCPFDFRADASLPSSPNPYYFGVANNAAAGALAPEDDGAGEDPLRLHTRTTMQQKSFSFDDGLLPATPAPAFPFPYAGTTPFSMGFGDDPPPEISLSAVSEVLSPAGGAAGASGHFTRENNSAERDLRQILAHAAPAADPADDVRERARALHEFLQTGGNQESNYARSGRTRVERDVESGVLPGGGRAAPEAEMKRLSIAGGSSGAGAKPRGTSLGSGSSSAVSEMTGNSSTGSSGVAQLGEDLSSRSARWSPKLPEEQAGAQAPVAAQMTRTQSQSSLVPFFLYIETELVENAKTLSEYLYMEKNASPSVERFTHPDFNSRTRDGQRNRLDVAYQLAAAFQYLHEVKNIVHLDVKPQNVLVFPVDKNTTTPRRYVAKIIDFGLACSATSPAGTKGAEDENLWRYNYGTPSCAPPCGNLPDTFKTEYHSIGLLLFHLLGGGYEKLPTHMERAAIWDVLRLDLNQAQFVERAAAGTTQGPQAQMNNQENASATTAGGLVVPDKTITSRVPSPPLGGTAGVRAGKKKTRLVTGWLDFSKVEESTVTERKETQKKRLLQYLSKSGPQQGQHEKIDSAAASETTLPARISYSRLARDQAKCVRALLNDYLENVVSDSEFSAAPEASSDENYKKSEDKHDSPSSQEPRGARKSSPQLGRKSRSSSSERKRFGKIKKQKQQQRMKKLTTTGKKIKQQQRKKGTTSRIAEAGARSRVTPRTSRQVAGGGSRSRAKEMTRMTETGKSSKKINPLRACVNVLRTQLQLFNDGPEP